jgi:hypothetical protein
MHNYGLLIQRNIGKGGNMQVSKIWLATLCLLMVASPVFAQTGVIDIDDLKHLTYTLHPRPDRSIQVRLFNGKYSRRDSPAEFVMTAIHEIATGDLNGDGKPDAAVILFSNYGGSGTFGELAAVINEDGLLRHVASAPLGDRVVIKSLAIDSGLIGVDMLTHGTKDPMATPTLRQTKKFKLVDEKLVSVSGNTSRQIQGESHEALVKKDLSMIITLKVAGQIQKTDVWTDSKLDPHNWHKPIYYIALDANGDPRDGYFDNGKGSFSALIQYDSGRYRLTWGGPDQNIQTKADNVVCPPTGWLTLGVSPEQVECAEDLSAYVSEDGTALIVSLRLNLIGNPSSLEVSFMASPYTRSHLDVLGNKPGDDGRQGWIVIPDATVQKSYSKKDPPEDLAWPIEPPDLRANFDIIEANVQILHVQ